MFEHANEEFEHTKMQVEDASVKFDHTNVQL